MRENILKQLFNYISVFPDEAAEVSAIFRQLRAECDPTARTSLPGHITASGVVLEGGELLMIRHPQLDRWLQPGGHVDPPEVVEQAALREVREETGVSCGLHAWHQRHGAPLDIDIHAIPANPRKGEPAHLHYDFRYLLTPFSKEDIDPELPTRWVPLADIRDAGLARLIAKLCALSGEADGAN